MSPCRNNVMKRMLILEDDQERIDRFHDRYHRRYEIVIVGTAAEAIQLLSNENWDIIFLDHDLGDGHGTGYEVACWLEQNQQRQPHKIVIHSWNLVGAAKMKAALPWAIQKPFKF